MIRNFIIGTAGHIDHGKTELVKALTGVDTDRLAEEKERGISIELGFAPLYLPSGLEAGIVDVPGHERFIKNMLAGSTGIDLLLLVVAADDGVMEQTIEHLAIADLLGIERAVIVVTKTDLVDDDRITEVEEQVRRCLAETTLKEAPLVRVSAVAKTGLDDLIERIETEAESIEERALDLPARLPIDRSFIMPGAGRVVTGTLWSGVLTTGGQMELLPSGQTCRPRQIEVHGNIVSKALAGQRVAVNLAVSGPPPRRGDLLVPPAAVVLCGELIGKIRVLKQADKPIRKRDRLRLHHGTAEVAAKVIPVEGDEIKPGEEGFARLVLSKPLPALFRDRVILRRQSPVATVAGGVVLEARPKQASSPISISRLRALAANDEVGIVGGLLNDSIFPLTAEDIALSSHLAEKETETALKTLLDEGKVAKLGAWQRVFYMSSKTVGEQSDSLGSFLVDFHGRNPLLVGPAKEEVKAKLWTHLSSSQADILFEHFISQGLIERKDNLIALAGREQNDPAVETLKKIEKLLGGFSPPRPGRLAEEMELPEKDIRALLARLSKEGRIEPVSKDIYFSAAALAEAEERLTQYLLEAGEITVSRFKDLLGTTRKYAVPLIEYFDRKKITRREGDIRVLG